MKKILVVFTGGTIGSTENEGVIDIDIQKNYRLISMYRQLTNKPQPEFETFSLLETLSENITSKDWKIICNYLFSIDFSEYSGVILTHGSDTLAFTSALIGLLFSYTEIPIILIASNLTLGVCGSNGILNFSKAVEHIVSGKPRGVFTIFDKTYLSTRIMPADSCLDKFSSYGNEETELIFDKISKKLTHKLPIKNIDFKNEVLMIYGYPNINFSAFNLNEKIAAVLYVPYHSGTACTDCKDSDYTLTSFIERCKKSNVPVYISGIKSDNRIYVTLQKLLKAGAKPMYDISEIAAYAKLMIAYNQKSVPVEELIEKDIFFEKVYAKKS